MAVVENLFNEQEKVVPNLFKSEKIVPNLFPEQAPEPLIQPKTPFQTLLGRQFQIADRPISKAKEFGEIKEADPIGNIINKVARISNMPSKALISDIPFVRKIIPEEIENIIPESPMEKTAFAGTKLARDLYMYSKTAGMKGLKFLAGAAGIGALTADSEDPMEIVGSAAKEVATMVAISAGFKYIPKVVTGVGRGVAKATPEVIKKPIRTASRFLGLKLKNITDASKLNFRRWADTQRAAIEGEKFAKYMEANLSVEQLKALPFMIEKKIPRTATKETKGIPQLLAKSEERAKLRPFAKQLSERYDSFHKQMIEIYGDDVSHVNNYINRLWDIPKEKQAKVVNWFMTRSKHLKQRRVKTIAEGIDKFGLTPKELNAAELYRYYNNNVTVSMANMKYMQGLSKLKTPELFDITTRSGKTVKRQLPMVMSENRAPKDWVKIEHPALQKSLMLGKTKKGIPIIQKTGVKVHPEIAEEVETIFGSKLNNDVVRAMEGVNAYAKYSQLTLSLFHHVALTEAALATGVATPKNMGKLLGAWKRGEKPILNNPIAKDAIENGGVQLGAPTDVHRNLLETSLMEVERNLEKNFVGKVAALPVKGIRKAIQANNRFLWDYLHPQYKLLAYEKLTQDSLKKGSKFAHLPASQVKREIGQFVNDTFGGQSWELLTKSPQWRQGAHALFLSPDWTLSTTRQAMSAFGGFGAVNPATKALREELGTQFWRNAALINYGSMNQLNRAFTKFYDGEARDLWDNEIGQKTTPFIGIDKNGKRKYLKPGKQFREIPELFADPTRKMGGKTSPLLQFASKFTLGISPSGFKERDIFEQPPFSPQALKGRALLFPKMFTPFSAQKQLKLKDDFPFVGTKSGEGFDPMELAVPKQTGMSYFEANEGFQDAIKRNDINKSKAIYKAALENGISQKEIQKIFKRAEREVNYKETGGYARAQEIYTELETLPREQRQSAMKDLNLDEATEKRVVKIGKQREKNKIELEKFRQTGKVPDKFLKLLEKRGNK